MKTLPIFLAALLLCTAAHGAPTSGAVVLEGKLVEGHLGRRSADQVRALQIVFQNPDAALNRRHAVRRILRRVSASARRVRLRHSFDSKL